MKSGISKIVRKNRTVIALVVLIGTAIVLYIYIQKNWLEFKNLEYVAPLLLIPITLVAAVNLLTSAQLMESILLPFGIRIPLFEAYGLSCMTRFSNYIVPLRLGFSIRAMYLKKNYDLTISKFISTLAGSHIILYIIAAVFGFVSTLFINNSSSAVFLNLRLGFVLLLVSLLVLAAFPNKYFIKARYIPRSIASSLKGFETIKDNPKAIARTTIWSIFTILTFSLLTLLEFRLFGTYISFYQSIYITAVASLSLFIAITPAGLGISEGLVIVAAESIGLPGSIALATALVRRVVILSVSGTASIYFSRRLFGKDIRTLLTNS